MKKLMLFISAVLILLASCRERIQNTELLDFIGNINSEKDEVLIFFSDSCLSPMIDHINQQHEQINSADGGYLILNREDSIALRNNYRKLLDKLVAGRNNIKKVKDYPDANFFKQNAIENFEELEITIKGDFNEMINALLIADYHENNKEYMLGLVKSISEKVAEINHKNSANLNQIMKKFDAGNKEDQKYLKERYGM